MTIDGFGKIMAESVVEYFNMPQTKELIDRLMAAGLNMKSLKEVKDMRVGQDAIAFKLYVTPSETQPITLTPTGAQAKKIQNIYVACQLISRLK